MYRHAPAGYRCPFCCLINGIEGDFPFTKQADVIYRDEMITSFISSHWRENNKGPVLVTPNAHIENLYEMPDDLLLAVHSFSRKVARALKLAYRCDGVSIRQNNESAGDQDVWHYHLHVVPRYAGDDFHTGVYRLFLSEPDERAVFADKVRAALGRE